MMLGDVNTINLTKLEVNRIFSNLIFNKIYWNVYFKKGGIAQNVVPSEFKALFDLRISVNTDPDEFMNMIVKMFAESEEGETDSGRITYTFIQV